MKEGSLKIFGIGLNKTGTKTLGACFTAFGFNNKSFDLSLLIDYSNNYYQQIFENADIYSSFEDWPWPLVYRELDKRYPNGLFIMTLRGSPEQWFESLCKHADRTGPTLARKIAYNHEMPHDYKDEHIRIYKKHIQDVRDYFRDRPGKLLEVCWENGDGWNQLANFLKRPVPEIRFPHENKSSKSDE